MTHNAEEFDIVVAGNEVEGPEEAGRRELELADRVAMMLPDGSGLRTLGRLFPARTAGARAAIGATNELRQASVTGGPAEGQPVWLTVPYGVYAHPRGTQVVDEESATEMARRFGQIWARLARGLRGLPVYIGHPDARGRSPEEELALAKAYPDKRVHGWIEALEAGDDGLRLRVRWDVTGQELVRREEYAYFSPHWGMLPILEQPGMYRPVELYSLGLTNHPNIPGLRVVGNDAVVEEPAAALPETEDGKEAHPPHTAGVTESPKADPTAGGTTPIPNANAEAAPAEESRLREALNEERRARCATAVGRALEEGRITLAAREQWLRNLELDYAGNERLLNLLPAVWNTGATNPVRRLGAQRESLGLERAVHHGDATASPRRRPDRIERIAREVTRRQQASREEGATAAAAGFHEIYQGVKKDHPEWFAEA